MEIKELYALKKNLEILAQGKDPKTGYVVEDTILESRFNKRILLDAASIIDKFLNLNYGIKKKYMFYIPKEDINKIVVSQNPIPISVFTYSINEVVNSKIMKKIKASEITAWLMKEGYLNEIEDEDGKKFKILTDKSQCIGISSEQRISKCGRIYNVNLYNEVGQRFILEHLEEISNYQINESIKNRT